MKSGSLIYLSVFSSNAGKYGPEKLRIRTRFTQCVFHPLLQCSSENSNVYKKRFCELFPFFFAIRRLKLKEEYFQVICETNFPDAKDDDFFDDIPIASQIITT